MLQRIEHVAFVSVSRACGFAVLAIMTFFVGLAGDMKLAFKAAGFLALITCLILLIKAQLAPRKPYKRTEVWIMLKPDERPSASTAQKIIGSVLRETFLRFAQQAAFSAAVFLAVAALLSLIGR